VSGRVAFVAHAADLCSVLRPLLLGLLGASLVAASPPRRPRPATGRIQGTVEISTVLSTRRPQFRPYAEPGTGSTPPAPPRDPIAAELKNVVIYLDAPGLADPAKIAAHATMAQHDERFTPHVLAIPQGSTVDFPNDDDVYHNVFSLSAATGRGGFDLGRYPKGTSKSWTFDRPGTVKVFCHIHSDMSAVILVLPNPFFATPDDAHHFTLDDVPEGDYTIVGWHERITPIVRHVRVTAGQTTNVDFNIPLPRGGDR